MNDMSIGLPRMRKEKGERRDFLPTFVKRLSGLDVQVVLEEGYGGGMDIPPSEYTNHARNLRFASHEETYAQDLVLVLRYPNDDELHLLKRGACLMSMVHLPTRPGRVSRLGVLGLESVSLDSVKDDTGRRLVENLRAVGWNGVETAFTVLRRTFPDFESPSRRPLRVTILGSGGVGGFAMQAAVRYGNTALWGEMVRRGVPGIRVTVVDHDVTGIEGEMRGILRETDVLVDATQRPDPSRIVIPNRWIDDLPIHGVILDLSVDPYDCGVSPPLVKAIEGVPHGDLDRFIFLPDNSAFEDLPDCVSTHHRRPTVSCYSWPGIHPRACMETYGKQIFPLIRTLVDAGGASRIDPQGRYFHRALSRGMLSHWAAEQGVEL